MAVVFEAQLEGVTYSVHPTHGFSLNWHVKSVRLGLSVISCYG